MNWIKIVIWYCVFLSIGWGLGFRCGLNRGQQQAPNRPGATAESITLVRPPMVPGRKWILIHAYWEHVPKNSPYYDFYRREPYKGDVKSRDWGNTKVIP